MSQTIAEFIGPVISSLRDGLNWTQKELASRSGVSDVVISRIEGGANLKLQTLEKLAIALGRHPYEIIWMAEAKAHTPESSVA